MKLPDKIKVGNITYDIELRSDLGEECLGIHKYKGNSTALYLSDELEGDKKRNIFFHELTHAILCQIGADDQFDDEMFVQSLANELDKLFELKQALKE